MLVLVLGGGLGLLFCCLAVLRLVWGLVCVRLLLFLCRRFLVFLLVVLWLL